MQNLYKYAVIGVMLICTSTVYGATVRDNYVYFENGSVKDFQWHESEHKITDGQPYDSISSGVSDGDGVIHIRAGRSGSEEVADWFNSKIGKAISTRDPSPLGRPDELNFATYGHMNIWDHKGRLAQCHSIVIGQGHAGAYNNWWFGSDYLHSYGGKYWMVCPRNNAICGAVVTIDPSYNQSDKFAIEVRTCPPPLSLSVSPDELWPANGKMVEIEATITGHDICGENYSVELVSVEGNEPGGGNFEEDIQEHELGIDDMVFKLRADHSGEGRTYTVKYDIVDGCDKQTTVETTVIVPRNRGKNKRLKK